MKRSVDQINARGLRVLVRLDLNVPLDHNGAITDDRRIQSALPTVRKLLGDGGRLVLMSHLGRPDEEPGEKHKYTLAPVAQRLSVLLEKPVSQLRDCIGAEVSAAVHDLRDGDVCLLENLRFHPEETIKDKKAADDVTLKAKKEVFARKIADLGDAYVNDAFGTCHRDNASMLTVPQLMAGKPRVVGYLVQRELEFLGEALRRPKRPFVCVLGGAKVSDKLGVIQSLLQKCDTILIGGAMAYTFLAAEGKKIGKSLVETDLIDTARSVRAKAGSKLRLPIDSVAAGKMDSAAKTVIAGEDILPEMMGLDIGPQTVKAYAAEISHAKTIFWNGPMGVFETPPFDQGTLAIARAIADATRNGSISIVGGGDSAAALDRAGLSDQMSHISTGGGASLEFLEGKQFLPLEVLDNAD